MLNNLEMHIMSHNGETMYLSPTWGDNQIYIEKTREMAFRNSADVVEAGADITKNRQLSALAAVLRAGEVANSDDKAKTVATAVAGEGGSRYTNKLLKDVMYKQPRSRTETAAEVVGGATVSGAVENMMDNRPGSTKNAMKASEIQRQQVQQQHVESLNRARDQQ